MAIQNHVLGKGKIRLRARDRNSLGTYTTGERYIGNSPEFSLNVESETLDHYDSDQGLRVKNRAVTLEVNTTGSFITDNIDDENLAMFFLGTTGTTSQTADAVSDEVINVEQGYYYRVGVSSSNPMGNKNISSLVVGDDATPTTTWVEGTDYSVDLVTGTIYIIPGGGIASSAAEDIYLDYSKGVESRAKVISGTNEFVGELFFECTNPEGEYRDYLMPYVKIRPNGEYALKGEEWQQMSFEVEVLKLDDTTDALVIEYRS